MVSNSNPITSALPTQISTTHFQPESWYQWTVSYLTVKTVIVGAVGVVFALTLYRMFYSSESSSTSRRSSTPPPTIVPKKTTGKTLPIPVPANELIAQGFIRINKSLFDAMDAPEGYAITEIRVRIEDSQGRRIVTRYLPNFSEDYDIFSFLPLGEAVTLKFKITRRQSTDDKSLVREIQPLKLQVEERSGLYRVRSQNNITYSPLGQNCDRTVQWQPQRPEAKTSLCSMRLKICGNSIEEGVIERHLSGIVLQNFDDDEVVRRVVFVFKSNITANQLNGVLDYAFIDKNPKWLSFRLMVKDWKAAYQLENGIKINYKPESQDLAHFHIDEVSCETYT